MELESALDGALDPQASSAELRPTERVSVENLRIAKS
jgi:hypothetical protein